MTQQDTPQRRMPPEPTSLSTSASGTSGSAGSAGSSSTTGSSGSTWQGSSSTSSTTPVTEQASRIASDVAQQAGQVKDQVKEQVKEQANSKVDDQKQRVATQISSFASALEDASLAMQSENPQIAQFAETAVDRLNQWSTQLERKDFGELIDDVERFARRNPALFVGAAFALGVFGARFLKSSAPESNFASQYNYRPARYSGYDYASSGRYSNYPADATQGWSGASSQRPDYSTPLRDTSGYGAATTTSTGTSTAGRTPGVPYTTDPTTTSTGSRATDVPYTTDATTRDTTGASSTTDME